MKRWLRRVTGGAPAMPLVVLFGLNAVDELDRTAFAVLLPEIREEFGLDLQGILTLIGVVTLGALLLQVPIAVLADRTDRVRLAWLGAAGWAAFSVLTGLATTLLVLAVARCGSGIGKAVVEPTHNSLLADYYDIGARARVYSFHRAANAVGSAAGPLVAGLLAAAFGWRLPFFVLAVPTVIFVALAWRLTDPVRGAHERRAAGATEDAVNNEEQAPSFGESWRIVWKIETLRRIWWSLPFLAASLIGFAALASLLYEEVFDLDERARGFAAAAAEPAQLVGLVIGARIATRLFAKGPAEVFRFLSHAAWLVAAALIVFATAPNIVVAIIAHACVNAAVAVLAPGIFASLSLAIPPRSRSTGYAVASLWVIPGLLVLPLVGWIGDNLGLRVGMLVLVPAFMIGGVIIATTRDVVAEDVAGVWRSAAARAEMAFERRQGRSPLLAVRGAEVSYDGVQVLFGVDLDVEEGECVALLGTNGAGKSTLLKAIAGVVEADRGAVVLDGREITHAPPHEIARLGVALVPGGQGVFPSLTVDENLHTAAWILGRGAAAEAVAGALDLFPVLQRRRGDLAGDLSGGQQQMLGLAMAFVTKPRVLMIDELSLGLAPVVVAQLLPLVEAARQQGTTVVLVEQSVNVALTVAQRAYFMEKGEIRFSGPTAELLDRPDVLRSVFLAGAGRSLSDEVAAAHPRRQGTEVGAEGGEPPALEAAGIVCTFGGITAVAGASIAVAPGEIVGIIGPNGAGKTTLLDAISGFTRTQGGRVLLGGRDITGLTAAGRARSGLGRSFQDARLFPTLGVAETIAVACERFVTARDPLSAALHLPNVYDAERAVTARVDELIELLGLGAWRDALVRELSTGTRRVVDLACLLAHRPTVILLDEPSSGIAQREAEALAPMLRRIRDETDASLVVIEHDMPLIRAVADRLVAMDQGQVIAEGEPATVLDHPRVIDSYLGTDRSAIERSAIP